jgi:uncharacterized phage protein (TIGR02216 family)
MTFRQGARQLAGQAGLLLGWRPDEFWRATPDELETALSALVPVGEPSGAPVDRATLQRLQEAFPDG